MNPDTSSKLGPFATRHALSITFIAIVLCLAGIFCAKQTPSSVFPKTDFPRVVVMVNNGIMPANEMMATVTRPIEEAMKSIPGVVSVTFLHHARLGHHQCRFSTGARTCGSSELFVLGQLSEIRSDLPATASTDVSRGGVFVKLSRSSASASPVPPAARWTCGTPPITPSNRCSCRSPA